MTARLDGLPPNQRSVLRFAAVIGPSFRLGALGSVLAGRLDASALANVLGQLSAAGFLLPGERETFAFSHALTRDVAYEGLPYAQRRQLHSRAGAHIEAEHADQLEAVSGLLLHHYEQARDLRKTVVYAAMSGDRAAAVFAGDEAIDYYRRALSALDALGIGGNTDRSLLHERIGDCLETSGHHREAAPAFVRALEEWRERPGRRPHVVPWTIERRGARETVICRKIAVSHERASDYDQALSWLDRALAALPNRASRIAAQVSASRSVALFRKGLYAEGIAWGRRALDLARQGGDSRDIAYAHNMLANSHMEQGALRRAIRHLRAAVRLYHELQDVPGQAAANNNLGTCYQELGTLDAARYHYELALRSYTWAGDEADAAIARNNLGEVLLAQGSLDEAESHLREVVRGHDPAGESAALTGLARVNLCRIELRRSRTDAAEAHLRRGMRTLRRSGALGLLTEARLELASLRLAQGRLAAALRVARSAYRESKRLERKLLESRALRLLGQVQAARGEPHKAQQLLRESVVLARRIDAGHEEALSLLALGRLLLPKSRAAARRDLQQATAILSRMNAEPDLAEASRLISQSAR